MTWSLLVGTWRFRPDWTSAGLLLLVVYLWGLSRSRAAGAPSVPRARVASYVLAVVLLVVTVSSSFDAYAMAAFWLHMVEHLMLIMVVPALFVLGHPLHVLRGATAATRYGPRVGRALSSGPVAVLTHPLVGLALYSAVIVATHLTGFMDAMMRYPWLMGAEKLLYLSAGYLFLLPVVGNEPIRWHLPHLGRLVLLLLAMTPDTVVGIVLMQTQRDPFPVMEAARPAWAPEPMRDLDIAGGVMWAFGDALMMVLGVGVIIAMIRLPGRGHVLGERLERVRRTTMLAHVARMDAGPAGEEPGGTSSGDVDVDEDADVLAAYNRMLQGLERRR